MAIVASSFGAACQTIDICNREIKDEDMTDRIIARLPRGTYTNLWVQTVEHKFTIRANDPIILSRMIQCEPTCKETIKNILRIVIQKPDNGTSNLNHLAAGMVGSADPRDQAEVQAAYRENKTVSIFVPLDGSYIYDISATGGKITASVELGREMVGDSAAYVWGRCTIL